MDLTVLPVFVYTLKIEHFVLRFDVLNAGKLVKDFSGFDMA